MNLGQQPIGPLPVEPCGTMSPNHLIQIEGRGSGKALDIRWFLRQNSPILNDLEVPISQPGVSPPRNPGLVGDEPTYLGPLILGGGV